MRVGVPLADAGHSLTPVVWDDIRVDWSGFDLVVLRSTWDYHKRYDDFRVWLRHLADNAVRVMNPVQVLMWNAHKQYLLDLQQRGIPIVPTVLLSQGRLVDLKHLLSSNRWSKAVVKPAVAATAYNTWLTEPASAERDQRQLVAMMARGDVLVQPFMQEIVRDGEYSFVFFGGAFSHCFRKQPRAGDYRTQSDYGARYTKFDPPDDWIVQTSQMLSVLARPMLYARVDCIVQGDTLVLMELELIEPNLSLDLDPAAPERFALAIQREATRRVAGDDPRDASRHALR
jgi:glutathione synthase/RimK-type ligase-like ATP-grasp enzyme